LKTFENEVRKAFKRGYLRSLTRLRYMRHSNMEFPFSHYAPESDAGREYRAIATRDSGS